MNRLELHDFHAARGAEFLAVNGCELVAHYGDPLTEYRALTQTAAVLDLSPRGRLCLLGADRERFLNGQVTNNIKALGVGEGCYAAVVTNQGRMASDVNVYRLADEYLLDFEPGLSAAIAERLQRYLVADDVQIADAAPHYALLSVQGPSAEQVMASFGWGRPATSPFGIRVIPEWPAGELYLANQPRLSTRGFDLFVPKSALAATAEQLVAAVGAVGGRVAGWLALETARVEAGIPRFLQDMDSTHLPPEAGLSERAISYTKGCYIGQEVLSRLHTIGHVNKQLCGLRLADDLPELPGRNDKLFRADQAVGSITSSVKSPALGANIALGYVRREFSQPGTELVLRRSASLTTPSVGAEAKAQSADSESRVQVVPLPFCARAS